MTHNNKASKERIMEVCRGVDIMGAQNWSDSTKLFAYLSIFHPEMTLTERLKISNAKKT